MWKRLVRVLMLAGAVFGVPAYLGATSFGGFGDKLDQARKTDFFTWFNLEQTGEERVAQATVTTFKPSGDKFRDLVTFKVTTGQNGGIAGLELILSRASWIAPKRASLPGTSPRACCVLPLPTILIRRSRISPVKSSISAPPLLPSFNMHSRKPPKLPSQPTPGYRTYLGQQQSYEHAAAGKTLTLANAAVNGEKTLVITIRTK